MDLNELIPKKDIPLFAELGKEDWLNYEMIPGNRTKITSINIPKHFLNTRLVKLILRESKEQTSGAYTLFAFSKAIAGGPKVISLSMEQCEVFEQIDIKVSFADYQQPYPAVFVELPDAYTKKLSKQFDYPAPETILVFHDHRTGYIILVCHTKGQPKEVINFLPPREEYASIEQAIHQRADEGLDIEIAEITQRIALNACLMLTHAGVLDQGPIDPPRYRGLQNAKRKPGKDIGEIQALIDAFPFSITFKQDIQLYRRRHSGNQKSEPSGERVKPHWRRGHFRYQRFGERLVQKKLIFISPVLVNADLFIGDLSETESIYRLPKQ